MQATHWIDQVHANTELIQAYFGDLDERSLNYKPHPNTWSIGQHIDHLLVINSSYFPTFDALLIGTYQTTWLAKIPFFTTWMGNFILKSVQPNNPKKIKTFPIWEPSTSKIPAGIVQTFVEHQKVLITYIQKLSNHLEASTIITSPANTKIVYRLPKAIEIIIAHEKRHIQQAKSLIKTG